VVVQASTDSQGRLTMGGHRNTIGKLERGETNFTFDYVVEIARALKVKPSVFLISMCSRAGKKRWPWERESNLLGGLSRILSPLCRLERV
jgi:hypothetical protein